MRTSFRLWLMMLAWGIGAVGLRAQDGGAEAEPAAPPAPTVEAPAVAAPATTPRFVRGTAATTPVGRPNASTTAAALPPAIPQQDPAAPTQRTTRQAHFEYDESTRTLIVTTDPATNAQVAAVIQALDSPVPQALIKVLFLEVIYNDSDDMGVDLKGTIDTNNGHTTVLNSVFGAGALTQGGIATISQKNIQATIAAIAKRDKTNVLSRPSVLALNNQQATITIGQTVPLVTDSRVTTNGDTINSVQYQDVGIILTVTPHIRNDGSVQLEVAPQISALSATTVQISSTVNAPVIDKRSANTTVVVPSGETVIIGGLMEDQITSSVKKVPVLGSIPGLGLLFRHTVKTKAKTELLIFLTPEVVTGGAALVAASQAETIHAEALREGTDPKTLNHYLSTPPLPTPAVPAARAP